MNSGDKTRYTEEEEKAAKRIAENVGTMTIFLNEGVSCNLQSRCDDQAY